MTLIGLMGDFAGVKIERLSPKPKQQLLSLIDTFIEAEALKQRSGTR